MKALMTWILTALLCLCVCTVGVARHHHHGDGGRPCLCLDAGAHTHSDCCDGSCHHGDDPGNCLRGVFNLTCDNPLRYQLTDMSWLAAVPAPCFAALLPQPAIVCTSVATDKERDIPPVAGFTGHCTRRGPPCR